MPNRKMAESIINTPEVKLITGTDMDAIYQSAPSDTMSIIDCRGIENAPTNANRWFGFQWKNASSLYGFQVAFNFDDDKIYKRYARYSTTLSSWRAI